MLAAGQHLGDGDSEDLRDGDSNQRAQHPHQGPANEHRKENRERGEMDTAAVQQRIQHVTLDLLVDDDVEQEDQRLHRRDPEGRKDRRNRSQGRADHRDQIEDGQQEREGQRVWDAEDRHPDVGARPGDQTDGEVTGDISGYGAGRPIEHPPQPGTLFLREELQPDVDDVGAVIQEEDCQHDDGDQGRDRIEGIRRHGGKGTDGTAQLARQRIDLGTQGLDEVTQPEGLGQFADLIGQAARFLQDIGDALHLADQ